MGLYDKMSGALHYGCFLEFILETTSQAFQELDNQNMLPPGIEIGIHNNDFKPCQSCERERETSSLFNPVTHCTNCIPVVTHTKQGICVLVKGHGRVLIMDLIPVLPSPQDCKEPLMKMYSRITESILHKKPPGWKSAFTAKLTKDKVVPEEMEQLSQNNDLEEVDKRYILVKLLNYGHEPNYQIRATQSIDAISKLTGCHEDCLAYQYAKSVVKLLSIKTADSFVMKKFFLTQTNYKREIPSSHGKIRHERMGLHLILTDSVLKLKLTNRINYSHPDYNDKLLKEGIIVLK